MPIKTDPTKFILPILLVIASAANISLWYYGRGLGFQVSTVVFILVWLNIVLGLFVYKRQPNISYILLGATFILELLLTVDLFWIIGRIM